MCGIFGKNGTVTGTQRVSVVSDRYCALSKRKIRFMLTSARKLLDRHRSYPSMQWLTYYRIRRKRGKHKDYGPIDAIIVLSSSLSGSSESCGWLHAVETDLCLDFSFAALVLKDCTKEAIVSQAMELTGVSYLFQARSIPFFSKRSEYLVEIETVHHHQNTGLRYLQWIDKPNPYVRYNIALILAEQGNFQKAMEQLLSLEQQNPYFTESWPLRLILTYQLQGYDASCTVLKWARAICGDSLSLQ